MAHIQILYMRTHTRTHTEDPEAFVLIYLFQRKKNECALVPEVVMVTKVCRMPAESACSSSLAM